MSFWSFLATVVAFGIVYLMFQSYLEHKREMKKMDLEASKKESAETE